LRSSSLFSPDRFARPFHPTLSTVRSPLQHLGLVCRLACTSPTVGLPPSYSQHYYVIDIDLINGYGFVFRTHLSPNGGANAAGASFLQSNQLSPTSKGTARRHRPKPQTIPRGWASFWAIDDATAPDKLEAILHQMPRPRLTMARCWAIP
jgi:hypothetical protein